MSKIFHRLTVTINPFERETENLNVDLWKVVQNRNRDQKVYHKTFNTSLSNLLNSEP